MVPQQNGLASTYRKWLKIGTGIYQDCQILSVKSASRVSVRFHDIFLLALVKIEKQSSSKPGECSGNSGITTLIVSLAKIDSFSDCFS